VTTGVISSAYIVLMNCNGFVRGKAIVQINHTLTIKRGAVRGMHYQRPPHAETKFVTCLRGEVFVRGSGFTA